MCKIAITPASRGNIERRFNKNMTDIFLIVDYIIDLDYDSVSIYSPIDGDVDNQIIFAGSRYGDIPIDKDEVVDVLKRLQNNKFSTIIKKNNVIWFSCWSTMDKSRGIVYSIDGNIPDNLSLQFLIRIEELTEPNWYYYEQDFNEFKKRDTMGISE